jgi:hypothetical protein
MERTEEPRVKYPYLIVKLRHRYAYPTCTDILARWCALSYGLRRVPRLNRSWLDAVVEGSELELPAWAWAWAWNLLALRNSSTSCSYCAFFVQVLDAIPGMQYSDQDYILINSELVGSQHLTPYRHAHLMQSGWRVHHSTTQTPRRLSTNDIIGQNTGLPTGHRCGSR